MSAPHCIVFLGPSLARDEAETILPAEYRAPAGQGDIFRACAERPVAIALIDGIFKDAPTARHREILWALSQGIPVFGASSMGALRAAELSGQGMIGIGLIYRWYRLFALLPDDAVAVTHSPAELGSFPVSDALVDIRRSLSAARRLGLITSEIANAELARMTALPFADRQMPEAVGPAVVRQKAADARTLLCRLAGHGSRSDWPIPKVPQPAIVHAWLDDLRDSGLSL